MKLDDMLTFIRLAKENPEFAALVAAKLEEQIYMEPAELFSSDFEIKPIILPIDSIAEEVRNKRNFFGFNSNNGHESNAMLKEGEQILHHPQGKIVKKDK